MRRALTDWTQRMACRLARWWMWKRRRADHDGGVHVVKASMVRDGVVLLALEDGTIIMGTKPEAGRNRTWTLRTHRRHGAGARFLQRCTLPRAVRPSDLGLPYAVMESPEGVKVFYGEHDDMSAALQNT